MAIHEWFMFFAVYSNFQIWEEWSIWHEEKHENQSMWVFPVIVFFINQLICHVLITFFSGQFFFLETSLIVDHDKTKKTSYQHFFKEMIPLKKAMEQGHDLSIMESIVCF